MIRVDRHPSVGARLGTGNHHVLAPEDLVQVGSALNFVWSQVLHVVVRGVAADAEIVEQFSHVLGFRLGAFEVGRVELHTLVTHFRHRLHGPFRILLKLAANRVQLKTDRDIGRCAG